MLHVDEIKVHKGIRFATADRFGAPRAFDGDLDALDVGTYGAQCPQLIGMMEQMLGQSSLPSDEDCFF
ncbi:MAG: hypothetical protein F2873_09740, partial [Actinobacteria bacterium]|nr:hypothetical protein [Actinomycetota bacterium]